MRYNSKRCGKYRSPLEALCALNFQRRGIKFEFEVDRIPYTVERTYLPDFKLPNGIYIETKGWFKPEDRTKHLAVRKQNPDVDIRFVFDKANNKLPKGSNTTYGMWCDNYGFKWAEKIVPQSWIEEKPRN